MNIPEIEVGILSAKEVRFKLNTTYRLVETGKIVSGEGKVIFSGDGKITLAINGWEAVYDGSLNFEPVVYDEASFDLFDVVIGINFHWERKEDQQFQGRLRVIIENEALTVVNILPVEDYLISVISSEMSATSSLELLKAHAVVSRSWLLAQKQKTQKINESGTVYQSVYETEKEYVRWYDREDHEHFDVCADDHCQRYQGITRASTDEVRRAVNETWGELLMSGNEICDARFSKCCGGISESFENLWEPVSHPYLTAVIDNIATPEGFDMDLKNETSAEYWILGNPSAFCNTHDRKVLSQVLNNYDQETQDFFRWKIEYSQEQISDLIRRRTGWDFGEIVDLVPVERGDSGRLIRLKVVGTQKTLIIGKELFIRKALSESHLYSSGFVVEKIPGSDHIPSGFILKGAGWGHGAGLCQIGAAVMGAQGYGYREILIHYFRGAKLERKY